jgi:tetratricopeptide (TPR) repeat protein
MTAEDENSKKEIHVHGDVEKLTTIGTVRGNVLIVGEDFAQELDSEEDAPSVPDDIKELFDKGWALRDAGKYEDARAKFQEALALSVEREHAVAVAKSKWFLAIISYEWDKNPDDAKAIFQECIGVFQSNKLREDIAATLFHLGVIELEADNLDQAEAYISRNLEIERKRGKKLRIASALHQLGWIEDHRGHSKAAIDFYDQAMTSFMSVYQENNAKTEREAIQGIAACYHHKGLVFEHDGKPEDAEINFVGALEWQRKAGVQINIGRILFLLARFKYRQNQYDIGTQFLDEATEIYRLMGDSILYAQCLDLKGRLYFTRGQTDKAIALFESALDAVKASGNYREVEIYLDKLGNVYLEARKFEQAKQFFEQARDISLRENSLEGYEESVEGLARIAHLEKKFDERDKLLLEGVETLEKLLLSAQAEPKRAFALGRIGSFYEMMEKYEQALIYYQKAKRAYETLEDIGGIANCVGSIARMHGLLKRRGEEFDTYRELKKLVDGSGYYELIAGTAINLGEIYMQIGNLDEAKLMFQEAELLCYRYNLVKYQQHLLIFEKSKSIS